jgi:hypothetical protein
MFTSRLRLKHIFSLAVSFCGIISLRMTVLFFFSFFIALNSECENLMNSLKAAEGIFRDKYSSIVVLRQHFNIH